MITAESLCDFWKVRDEIYGISFELGNLLELKKLIGKEDLNSLSKDYELTKSLIEKLAKSGYFDSKLSDANTKKCVSDILQVQNRHFSLIKTIWKKELSTIKNYDKQNFKLCVRPIFADTAEEIIPKLAETYNTRPEELKTTLLSHSNITLTDPRTLTQENYSVLPYGFVYEIDDNFLSATDTNTSAQKLKTPRQIIKSNSSHRFTQNNNTVNLNGSTRPAAIFYFGYGVPEISKLYKILSPIAERLNLPVIEIDMHSFYQNNGKFISTNKMARGLFNRFIKCLNDDIKYTSGTDCIALTQKIIGFNSNLRLNFIYKFFLSLQKKLQENNGISKNSIGKWLSKAIAKQNTLTLEREKLNGKPLLYPNDETPVSVPNSFLNGIL